MTKVIRKSPDSGVLLLAIEAVKNGLSYRKASSQFKIPTATIHSYIKRPTSMRIGPVFLLNHVEETILIDHIEKCKRRGFPCRKQQIVEGAQSLLKRRQGYNSKEPIKCPGNSWFYAFMRRNRLAFRKAESLSRPSACLTKSNILSWFNIVETFLNGNDTFGDKDYSDVLKDPARCYNADESFFLLNPSNGPVVVAKGSKNVYEIKNGCEKEGVTVMGCFSADGGKVKQQCIFRYDRVPAVIRSSFPPSMHLSVSKSGWMNADLFIEFIQDVFHPHVVQKHGLNVPVILFVDGHSSHLSLDVCLLCDELEIILVQLYPNSTFLTQPADVSCFRSLKSIWRKEIINYRENDLSKLVTKAAFGELMQSCFAQLTRETIINGFRASGICPWNPENIDYSKCLGEEKISTIVLKTTNEPSTVIKKVVSIDCVKFSQIVGMDVMDMLETDPFSLELTRERAIEALVLLHKAIKKDSPTEVESMDEEEEIMDEELVLTGRMDEEEEIIDEELILTGKIDEEEEIMDEELVLTGRMGEEEESINEEEKMIRMIEEEERMNEDMILTGRMDEEANRMIRTGTLVDDAEIMIRTRRINDEAGRMRRTNEEAGRMISINDEAGRMISINDEAGRMRRTNEEVETLNEEMIRMIKEAERMEEEDETMNEISLEEEDETMNEISLEEEDETMNEISLEVVDDTYSRYDGALPEPPTTSRKNKRMLKVKPHFVLTSKPELARRVSERQEKIENEVAKQQRVLDRELKKKKKAQNVLVNCRKRAESALKKAEAAAAKLESQTEAAAKKQRTIEIKAAAKLLKVSKIKKEKP